MRLSPEEINALKIEMEAIDARRAIAKEREEEAEALAKKRSNSSWGGV
ncbi:MAG: hypothetical protein QM755_08940 [Luteolibacter sp.]